jgi:hypothetical protein
MSENLGGIRRHLIRKSGRKIKIYGVKDLQ